MLVLLLTTASAADLSDSRLMLGVGVEAVTNDPFVYRRGVRLSVGWSPNPLVEVGASGAWYPTLGTGGEGDLDWRPLTNELGEYRVVPDLSLIQAQGQLTLRIHALRASLGGEWTGSVGVLAGMGVMATRDDLNAIADHSAAARATQNQLHGSSALGGFVQARTRRVGVRVRYESDVYIETIASETLEFKDNAMFGVEVLCWL